MNQTAAWGDICYGNSVPATLNRPRYQWCGNHAALWHSPAIASKLDCKAHKQCTSVNWDLSGLPSLNLPWPVSSSVLLLLAVAAIPPADRVPVLDCASSLLLLLLLVWYDHSFCIDSSDKLVLCAMRFIQQELDDKVLTNPGLVGQQRHWKGHRMCHRGAQLPTDCLRSAKVWTWSWTNWVQG